MIGHKYHASGQYSLYHIQQMSVIFHFVLFILNIVLSPPKLKYKGFPLRCVPSFACWIFGVILINRSSRESFWAKELLDTAGSCSVDWSDFNVLLIFWFIFFLLQPPYTHSHSIFVTRNSRTGNPPPSVPVPMYHVSTSGLARTRVQNKSANNDS